MQKFIISSGSWTEGGNFSGYTIFGKRIHVFGHQMRSAGFSKEHTTFPFIVVAEEKSYEARIDENGKPIGQAIKDRLTATAVFATEDKFVEAAAMEQGFDARVERKIAKKVQSLEFDIDAVKATA